MVELIHETTQKARKSYFNDASHNIDSLRDFNGMGLSFGEWRTLVELKNNRWRISKGEVYIRQYCKQGYDVYVFRTTPKVHAIMVKYDLYNND